MTQGRAVASPKSVGGGLDLFPPAKRPRPTLEPYQVKAREYLIARSEENKGGALYMQMRLGKTVVMCDFISTQKPNDINLVICTYSVLNTWKLELSNFGITDIQILEGKKQDRIKKLDEDVRWFIVNYEMIEKLEILKYKFDNIIIDESVKVANPQTGFTKYILKYSKIFPRIYLLAGKSCPQGIQQLITQFIIFNKSCLGKKNYYSVRNEFFDNEGYAWKPKPNTEFLLNQELHENAFVLSRKEAGLHDEKMFSLRAVKQTTEQRKAYRQMLSEFEFDGLVTNYHFSQQNFLQQISGGFHPLTKACFSYEKLKEMYYLFRTELKDESVLIWCKYVHEMKHIVYNLGKNGFHCEGISGLVDKEIRENIRLRFNERKLKYVCAVEASMYQGTDWSGADIALFYSNEFSYDKRSNALERIYHITKKRPLLFIDLVTENTLDIDIVDLLSDRELDHDLANSKLFQRIKQSIGRK